MNREKRGDVTLGGPALASFGRRVTTGWGLCLVGELLRDGDFVLVGELLRDCVLSLTDSLSYQISSLGRILSDVDRYVSAMVSQTRNLG